MCDIGAVEVAPPSTATSAASDVGTSSATLNGSAANPNALIGGAVFFQFGRDTGYGSQTPAQLLAPGAPVTAFSAGATGLPSGTVIHYRAVAITADGVGFGADQTFTTAAVAPSLAALRIRPSTFRSKPGRGPSIARRRPLIGASVSYRDSQAATTTFTAQRALKGFRSGPRCVAKRPRSGKPRRCTRYRSSGAFTHTDRMGSNSFHFSGRVKRRPLAVGRYRLRAVARNAAGLKSAARFATFRIVG